MVKLRYVTGQPATLEANVCSANQGQGFADCDQLSQSIKLSKSPQ